MNSPDDQLYMNENPDNWNMAMDAAASVNAATPVRAIDIGEPDALSDNICLNDIVSLSSNGARMQEPGNAGEILTRIELDVAYSSEKLLNLDILLMQVSSRDSGCELVAFENDNIPEESAEKWLEFDLLAGILDSELRELSNFMAFLQTEIEDAHQKNYSGEHFQETFVEIEDKLLDSEETLNQSQNQLGDLKMQFAKFQGTLSTFSGQEKCGNKNSSTLENGQFPHMESRLKMQTVEQQKHILRMLEKSLARELDMEKKLCDSISSEDELRKKLYSAQQDLFWMEEETEVLIRRLFDSENAAEILMGISKELMGRLQILQFNLKGSMQREDDTRSTLINSTKQSSKLDSEHLTKTNTLKDTLKEAEDKYVLADSEASILRGKMHSLEEQLKESETKLQKANACIQESQEQPNILSSELRIVENTIDDLKDNISKEESRAENLAAKYAALTETNMELSKEVNSLRINGLENVSLLKKKLRESDIQLEHAKASAEANQEHQNMLYDEIEDMKNLIADLKSKIPIAESRAEKAEAKCVLLSENNLEIDEEFAFLRSRMECLKISLNQADDEKIVTAKEICNRTSAISDLVMRLAKERERIEKQMSSLVKQNRILPARLDKDPTATVKQISEDDPSTYARVSDEAVPESSACSFQVDKISKEAPVFESELKAPKAIEEVIVGRSAVETVRSLDVWQLNSKYYLVPILILLVSMLAVYLLQLEKCPF